MNRHPQPPFRRSGAIHPLAVVAIGVAAVLAAGGIFAFLYRGTDVPVGQRLDLALRQLPGGSAGLWPLISDIRSDDLKQDSDRAKLELLTGVTAADAAEDAMLLPTVFEGYGKAAEHLLRSHSLGFPGGYKALGHHRLGLALERLRRGEEALPHLQYAIDHYPQGRFDAIERVAGILLAARPPRLSELQTTIARWLELPALPLPSRHRAVLMQVHGLLAAGQADSAEKLIGTLPEQSVVRFEAATALADHIWQSACDANRNPKGRTQWNALPADVVNRIESLLLDPPPEAPVSSRLQSQILQANCLRCKGLHEAALVQLGTIRTNYIHSLEAVVAAVEELDLLVALGRCEAAVRAAALLPAICGEPAWYDDRWRSWDDLQARLARIGAEIIDKKAYESAVQYAAMPDPLLGDERRTELLADAYLGWARLLQANTDGARGDRITVIDEPVDPTAAALYGKAAAASEKLAAFRSNGPAYLPLLWQAIDCYSRAADYVRSNLLIDQWLIGTDRRQRPTGYLRRAANLVRLQQFPQAIEAIGQCETTDAQHPATAAARLLLADIYREGGDYPSAAAALTKNLHESQLTPASDVWRQSLFELGEINCIHGGDLLAELLIEYKAADAAGRESLQPAIEAAQTTLMQGIQALEQADLRYPDNPDRHTIQYRIGQSYHAASRWPIVQLETQLSSSNDVKEKYRRQWRESLIAAAAAFNRLREELLIVEEQQRAPSEQQRLRNAFLMAADIQFELQDYEAAAHSYRSVANFFLQEATSLEALSAAAECYRRLGRAEDAQLAIAQAIDILDRIDPNDASFAASTRGDRDAWKTHLTWLAATIGKL